MHNVIEKIIKILHRPKSASNTIYFDHFKQYKYGNEMLNIYKSECFDIIKAQYKIEDIKIGYKYYFNPFLMGNSGSCIFFSSNFKFAIKLIRNNEFFTLMKIIDRYVEYVKNNPDTLIVKIIGCYSYVESNTTTYFIIMMNVFDTTQIEDIYDLKGHNLHRRGNKYVKKDRDFMENQIKIRITNENAFRLQKDVEFLRLLNVMDYSLIIGINNKVCNKHFFKCNTTCSQKTEIEMYSYKQYSIGIIDILTSYNNLKKLENCFNIFCLCTLNKSSTDPKRYADRFLVNLNDFVLYKET